LGKWCGVCVCVCEGKHSKALLADLADLADEVVGRGQGFRLHQYEAFRSVVCVVWVVWVGGRARECRGAAGR
jgi:hypothetical protein